MALIKDNEIVYQDSTVVKRTKKANVRGKKGYDVSTTTASSLDRSLSEGDDFSYLNEDDTNKNKSIQVGDVGFEGEEFDWNSNPTAVEILTQYYERFGGDDSEEGIAAAAKKMVRSMSRTLSTKDNQITFTIDQIIQGIKLINPKKSVFTSNNESSSSSNQGTAPKRKVESAELVPLFYKTLKVVENKMPLYGDELEMCKMLKCPALSIQLLHKDKGPLTENGLAGMVCSQSWKEDGDWTIHKKCPKIQPLSPKEKALFNMFLQHTDNEVAAKKLVIATRTSSSTSSKKMEVLKQPPAPSKEEEKSESKTEKVKEELSGEELYKLLNKKRADIDKELQMLEQDQLEENTETLVEENPSLLAGSLTSDFSGGCDFVTIKGDEENVWPDPADPLGILK